MSAYSCPSAGPDACQSTTSSPSRSRPAHAGSARVNLTTVTTRALHAVVLPPADAGGRMLGALAAALDGTGPAILPLDPALPRARLAALLDAFAPSVIETAHGPERYVRA